MEIGKKFELLMEKAVSFKLGALMLKPSRSVLVIYSTSAERPPPEPPPQAVMNIRIGWLLLRPSSTLQETEFGFSSLELGTERPPRKPPWVNSGWVGLASFELCFSICVLVVVFVCYLSCFVCCVLFLYLVDFKSLYHVSLLCWHHRSFIVLYEDEYRFPTFAIYQLFFVQNDKVKKSETKCSRNERDVVEKMIRNWIEKKTLDSHISFVRYRRWKLLMDWLLEYEIWLKSSYLSAKFLDTTAAHLIIVMAFKDSAKSELHEIAIKSSKEFPLFGTSLASIESLSMPKVHEVVLSADMQCEKCQKRVIDIITK